MLYVECLNLASYVQGLMAYIAVAFWMQVILMQREKGKYLISHSSALQCVQSSTRNPFAVCRGQGIFLNNSLKCSSSHVRFKYREMSFLLLATSNNNKIFTIILIGVFFSFSHQEVSFIRGVKVLGVINSFYMNYADFCFYCLRICSYLWYSSFLTILLLMGLV